MTDQITPCPWCGDSTNITTQLDKNQGNKWGYAYCSCGTRGPEVRTSYDDAPAAPWRAQAMQQWNQRACVEEVTIAGLRTAVADYMQSEGCGCCGDYEKHKVHKDKLGELLGLPALPDIDDTVYYNFSPYKSTN